MQIKRLAALSLAAIFTTFMLTGCPWDKDNAESSDLPSSSSGSTSQGGSGDTGNTGDTGGESTVTDYTVTVNIGEHGKVTFNDTDYTGPVNSQTISVPKDTTLTFTVTPDAEYTAAVTVNGTTLSTADNQYSFTVQEDCTVTVTFKDQGYTIKNGVYEVRNADGLLAWNEAAQSDLSLNCTLTADIDLSDETWTPIGNNNQPYTGTFDGRGHTISGLKIVTPDKDYVGLFGYIGSGTVQNLNLEITSIFGNDYVGGVVGYNSRGTVTGCCFAGDSVEGSDQYAHVGGVVGYNLSGSVTGCCFAGGNVEGSGQYAYVGGVAGVNYQTVTDCYWQKGPDAAVGSGSADGCTPIGDGGVSLNDAIDAMNELIASTGYQYALEGDKPVLKPTSANTMLAEHFGLRWPF